jgi:YggT family protein
VSVVFTLLYYVVLVFFILLIGRLVFDWIQFFARDWKPAGPLLVVAEVIYSVTDPPLLALRKVLPPLRIGQVQIDLAFFVMFFIASILLSVLGRS